MIRKLLFMLGLLICAAAFAQAPLPEIDKALQPYVDNGDLPGMVTIIARRGEILNVNCVGWQDKEKGIKMSPKTVFWVASQTKPITATAVMMLVEEGLVKLDAPVTEYLPELKNLKVIVKDDANGQTLVKQTNTMTVRHLLSHTSGMQFLPGPQTAAGKIDLLPFSLGVYGSAATPLLFQPGEGYRYANQDIDAAATILERVSGMKYEDFVKERIFKPLGMKTATFWPGGKLAKRVVTPYGRDEEGKLVPTRIKQLQYPLDDRSKRYASAAGGLFCSAEDLSLFYRMIACGGEWNGKRIISRESIREMGTRQTPDTVSDNYGLGWRCFKDGMGHGGAMGTNSRVFTKKGYVTMYFILQDDLPKRGEAYTSFLRAARAAYKF